MFLSLLNLFILSSLFITLSIVHYFTLISIVYYSTFCLCIIVDINVHSEYEKDRQDNSNHDRNELPILSFTRTPKTQETALDGNHYQTLFSHRS